MKKKNKNRQNPDQSAPTIGKKFDIQVWQSHFFLLINSLTHPPKNNGNPRTLLSVPSPKIQCSRHFCDVAEERLKDETIRVKKSKVSAAKFEKVGPIAME